MKPKEFLENLGKSDSLWMYACGRCGECVDVCPVYKETDDKYTAPGYKIKKMRGMLTNKLFGRNPSEDAVKKIAMWGRELDFAEATSRR